MKIRLPLYLFILVFCSSSMVADTLYASSPETVLNDDRPRKRKKKKRRAVAPRPKEFKMPVCQAGRDYVEKYKMVAIAEMERSGIPASLILAQGIRETNCGRSELCQNAYNHFGVKNSVRWDGSTYTIGKNVYRCYASVEESFIDHTEVIKNVPCYGFCFQYDTTDYVSWAYGIKRAGYAEDPYYAEWLVAIIQAYELWKYDSPEKLAEWEALAANDSLDTDEVLAGRPMASHGAPPGIGDTYPDTTSSLVPAGMPLVKKITVYEKAKPTTQYNDKEAKSIAANANNKPAVAKAKTRKHVVRSGDTLWDISKKYGVSIKKIRDANNLRTDKLALKQQLTIPAK